MEYIISYIICCFMLFCYTLCFASIENKKIKECKYIGLIFLILLGAFIIQLLNYTPTVIEKYLISVIILSIIYFVVLKRDLKKALIVSSITYIISLILDMLFLFCFQLLNNIDSLFIEKNYLIIKILLSIALSVILVVIFHNKWFKKIIVKSINLILDIKNSSLLIGTIIITYIVLSTLIYNMITMKISLIYSFILFTLLTILFIGLIFALFKNQKIENNYQIILDLNSLYGEIIENDKVYRHNIKNKFMSISNVGSKKVKSLINEIIDDPDYQLSNCSEIYNIPQSLMGIFGNKLYKYGNKKITVLNTLKNDEYKDLNIKEYNKLCEIIGITLDNVIEEVIKIDDGYINIIFNKEKENLIIIIRNNYDGNIDVDKLGERNYSTKQRGSGYGLYSINKIKFIDTNYKLINNEFEVTINLKKSKK